MLPSLTLNHFRQRHTIADLASRIRDMEDRCVGVSGRQRAENALQTLWGAVDDALPDAGLRRGATHEWLTHSIAVPGVSPSLGILTHLARRALDSERAPEGRAVVWVGRAVWAHPQSLVDGGDDALLYRSIFIEARSAPERVWAMDLALRCAGVCAVVGDAKGIDMSMSRRLQLAAGAGSAIGLLAREGRERGAISAATTRWSVGPARTNGRSPRWEIRLLRCKGRALSRSHAAWLVESRRGQGVVCVSADVEHRPLAPTGEAQRVVRKRSA